MRWVQALVFCGGLLYAAVDDIRTREVNDLVSLIIAMAGLITFSPAAILGVFVAGVSFYLCASFGKTGAGDTRLTAAAGFVMGWKRALIGIAFYWIIYALFVVAASIIHWLRYRQPLKSFPLVPIISAAFIPAYFI